MLCSKEDTMNNRSDRRFRAFAYIVLSIAAITCLYPFFLLIMSSFTDEQSLIINGYSIFPKQFSLNAYKYIFAQYKVLLRAYGITIFTTVVGTSSGLFMTILLAYALSQANLSGRKILTFLVVFSMLFNGGLVSTYLWYCGSLHIKNTIFSLIVPGLMTNGFMIMIAFNYFRNNVPYEVIEAARVDGAGEFRIFFKIVVPFSKPIIAAVGLMTGIAYWNDWRNGLYYLTDQKLYNIQNILNRMMQEIAFLSSGELGAYAADYGDVIPGNGVRMAIAVIAVIPILIIYPIFQKQFAKGLTFGSVKG